VSERKSNYSSLNTRYPPEKIEQFETRAALMGKSRSEMMRQLADAFIEGRITIAQTPIEKQLNERTYK